MMTSELLAILTVCLYALGAVCILAGTLARRKSVCAGGEMLALCGFIAHTVSLGLGLGQQYLGSFDRGYLLQVLSWCLLAVVFLIWWRLKLAILLLFAVPITLALYVFSLHMAGSIRQLPMSMARPFFLLHIGTLFSSLAFMSAGFGAGIVFLILENKIKNKQPLSGFQRDLPALATFDKVNKISVFLGFPLFTIGIVSGFIWAEIVWGRSFSGDPKEIVSLGILALYAVFFHQRMALGWQGKKTAAMAILIFVVSLFSLYANTILNTHHSFA